MARFRDRDGELSALEAALRNGRPQPGAGLERDIAQSVGAPTGRRGARPALALLLTTGAAAAFLSFGGVGYAVDWWRGTSPWFLLVGLTVGILFGFYNLVASLRRS